MSFPTLQVRPNEKNPKVLRCHEVFLIYRQSVVILFFQFLRQSNQLVERNMINTEGRKMLAKLLTKMVSEGKIPDGSSFSTILLFSQRNLCIRWETRRVGKKWETPGEAEISLSNIADSNGRSSTHCWAISAGSRKEADSSAVSLFTLKVTQCLFWLE